MATNNSTSAVQTAAKSITKGDLLNEMSKQIGILSAQIAMMARPDSVGFEGVLSDDEKGWYILAMEERIHRLKEINERLWKVN